jgi:hypothetical protein
MNLRENKPATVVKNDAFFRVLDFSIFQFDNDPEKNVWQIRARFKMGL